MCGICGFYQKDKIADQAILKRMNDQIIHRGPDDEGFFFCGQAGLAARRLSIIDVAGGHQPLSSNSGNSWVALNGEIYNFKELREELRAKGYTFRTFTDTEVIVNLYEEYGLEFPTKLRGMFAVAIWDRKLGRLVIARDRIGIKPLYYHDMKGTGSFVFGSELKTILQYPGVKREIDREALDHFLTLEYIPAPFSIFKGIKKLLPGHMLIYEKNDFKIKKYWELKRRDVSSDFNEAKEEFLSLFSDCVKMRMVSDVPLGAFLSGGVDSSAITAFMAGHTDDRVKTFSIGFEEKSYSELKYSKIVSDKFNTDHYVKNLSPDINDLVKHLCNYLDEPLGDFSNFPTYLVSKTAREKVTVVLSGDGGDEIFGGYEHYIAQKSAALMDLPLVRPFHGLFSKTTSLFPPSELKKGFVNRIKRYSEGFENSWDSRHFRWMLFLSSRMKKGLYSEDFLNSDYLVKLRNRVPFNAYFERSDEFKGINKDLFLDFNTYMVDNILVKVDRMSMAASLEARVPFLDHKLCEFAFSLDSSMKVRGKTTKWFLKKSLEGILPHEIIYRRKEGFSIPIKNWLKKDLRDLMENYLSEKRVKESGLFNYAYIDMMKREHLDNVQNHAHRLWSLILFFMWKEKFLV